MDPCVLAIGFGEPAEPDPAAVRAYLEGIFLDNMAIEGDVPEDAAAARASELADARAPGLLEEYEAIGGSPLGDHLEAHARRLEAELRGRGHDVPVHVATQYFRPSIESAVEAVHSAGRDHVVGLPMYPLCGPSTTVRALSSLAAAIDTVDGWDPALTPIAGWHRHPRYNRLRAANVRAVAEARDLDLGGDVELVFSAHGTPLSYLEAGSRYDTYVEEYCEVQARLLGLEAYTLGFQNHESRGVEWTEPDVETALASVEADGVLVEPVSFIHEQSETISELDVELAEHAEDLGLAFDRVPVPHDDPELAGVLADLVEPAVAGFDDTYYGLRACRCADTPGTRCLCGPVAR
ncbi:MAG: ferrochelatase [Halobacteriales archaeon]